MSPKQNKITEEDENMFDEYVSPRMKLNRVKKISKKFVENDKETEIFGN